MLWHLKSPAEHADTFARVSSSRAQEPLMAFAGGALPHTILSCCHGTLLGMFDTKTVLPLRSTCSDALKAIAAYPWEDTATTILGHLGPALLPAGPGVQKGAWRGCFPHARAACISEMVYHPQKPRRAPAIDEDFVHLKHLKALSMCGCLRVTDAAFVHLAGIHTLDMGGCNQAAITDCAFAHLVGIKSLNMSECKQPTITDAAFAHLAGIQSLDMGDCAQATITDAGFAHLVGIKTLRMSACTQHTISDAAFVHLKGIQKLSMWGCNQPTITDAAFVHLVGIQSLRMSRCTQAGITDAALS